MGDPEKHRENAPYLGVKRLNSLESYAGGHRGRRSRGGSSLVSKPHGARQKRGAGGFKTGIHLHLHLTGLGGLNNNSCLGLGEVCEGVEG